MKYVRVIQQGIILTITALLLSSCRFGFLPFDSESTDTLSKEAVPVRLGIRGASEFLVGACEGYSISALAEDGFFANVPASTTINFKASVNAAGNTFFSDRNCAVPLTNDSLLLPVGRNTQTFYMRRIEKGSFTLTASASGLNVGTAVIDIVSDVPFQLAVVGDGSLTAGACGVYSFELRDSFGNLTVSQTARTLALSGEGNGEFYSASGCANGNVINGNTTIPAGASSLNVWYKNNNAQSVTLRGNSAGLQQAQISVNVNSGAGINLVVTGSPNITTDTCGSYSFTLRDANNNDTTPGVSTTVNLTDNTGAGRFYSDSGCNNRIFNRVLAASQSSRNFYFKNTMVQTSTVAATITGGASGSLGVGVGPGNPAIIEVAGSTTVNADACTGYTISRKDAAGNNATVNSGTNFSINDGSGNGRFYTSNACSGSGSTNLSTSILSGQFQRLVYYKNATPQNVQFVTNVSGVTNPPNYAVTVQAGAGVNFVVTGNSPVTADNCTRYVVTLKDAAGNDTRPSSNLTLALTGQGNGSFHSNSACTQSSSIVLNTSETFEDFWYKNNTPESVTLKAKSGAIEGTKAVTVTAGAPSELVLAGSNSIGAGSCAAYTITRLDQFDNPTSPNSTTSMTLTLTGSGAWYSDMNCTANNSTAVIAANSTSVVRYFKSLSSGNVTLRTSSSLQDDTFAVTVNSGTASQLAFSGDFSITTGECSQVTIQRRDSNGNAVTSGSLRLNLSENGSGSFYSNSTCSSATSAINYANGDHSKSFYFRSTAQENVGITATQNGGGLTGTQSVDVRRGRLVFTMSDTTLTTGQCAQYRVQRQDRDNNAWAPNFALTVDLNGKSNGKYSSSSGCGNNLGQRTIAANNHTITFYYSNDTVEDVTLSIEHPQINNVTLNVSIASGSGGSSGGSVNMAEAWGGAVQTDGKIIVVGHTEQYGTKDIVIQRFHANGNEDELFGKDSISLIRDNSGDEVAYAAAIQNNGYILVGGYVENGGQNDMILWRLDPSGNIDVGFNSTGRVVTDFGGASEALSGLSIKANGDIVIGGYANDSGSYAFRKTTYDLFGLASTNAYGDSASSMNLSLRSAQSECRVNLSSELVSALAGASLDALIGNGSRVDQPLP